MRSSSSKVIITLLVLLETLKLLANLVDTDLCEDTRIGQLIPRHHSPFLRPKPRMCSLGPMHRADTSSKRRVILKERRLFHSSDFSRAASSRAPSKRTSTVLMPVN
ncbi:hypothetical protein C8R47DRAFT_1127325 [Mycena vitilis]|nr:hypothetical protein C8R47DRAFT_1127325 [Mycena vitilis]